MDNIYWQLFLGFLFVDIISLLQVYKNSFPKAAASISTSAKEINSLV